MLRTFIFLFDSTRPGDYAFTRFHLLVYRLVCEQDYTKTTERISTKVWSKKSLGREQIPKTPVVDLDEGTDPGMLFFL